MLIFDTKIGMTQYMLSILGCFYILPLSYLCFYENKSNDLGKISIGIIFIIVAIIQFSFTLKSIQVYSDSLVIHRPCFIFKRNRKFAKKEIQNVSFIQSTSRIGAGNYLVVKSKDSEESFMLLYSNRILKSLVEKFKEMEIETEVKFKIV
ncbi:hypothetical protein [Flavobacterium caeni]|uniref:PH domain-containing protein n=1 Tax=Flavobacterium caeni TaxID=490189 RepID=A0A1G5KJQ8_9FLAO|nr:hypothetical protein [Flavobacterium caeni]SCZ00604.1 hypothetical protein SAMN02927903_03335 [Flavobacterium caeni]